MFVTPSLEKPFKRKITSIEMWAMENDVSIQQIGRILKLDPRTYHHMMKSPKDLTISQCVVLTRPTKKSLEQIVLSTIKDTPKTDLSPSELKFVLSKWKNF